MATKVHEMLGAMKGYLIAQGVPDVFVVLDSSISGLRTWSCGEDATGQWLRIRTKDRLKFVEHAKALGDIANVHGFKATADLSFSWETSTGRNYLPAYVIFLSDAQGKGIKPLKLSRVCFSPDPRADMDLFALFESTYQERLGNASYVWTREGVNLYVNTKDACEKVKRLFSDCTVSAQYDRKGRSYTVSIVFPGEISDVLLKQNPIEA